MRNVTLILDDGTCFRGKSFGYEKPVVGEVVFNTAMTGYPESLTDPSYAGQLMTLTFPLIGNYGVPPLTIEKNGLSTFLESKRIYPEAIIVSDYSDNYSHWNAKESLASWLKKEQVVGMTGVDTRELTKVLREHGVMMGRILFDDEATEADKQAAFPSYSGINYVDQVSCKEIIVYAADESCKFDVNLPADELNKEIGEIYSNLKTVVLMDCGVKDNILRLLLKRKVKVVRVPWNYDFNSLKYDGLFISNGPGDPDTCDAAVQIIRKAMQNEKLPIYGICLGNQLLSKAGGAKTYKLKYGHRSQNQPVRLVGTNRCFITSQNHGYAVDNNTLSAEWEPLFINMNDGSNEGVKHVRNPWFSSQFHPEACGGPTDTEFLFDKFVELL